MDIPQHVAIIMDGNRRWAEKKNLPGIVGHHAGVKSVDLITEACARAGVKALTLYTFSTENWKRPKEEVDLLLNLLRENLRDKAEKLCANNIIFNVIGRIEEFPPKLKEEIEKAIETTSKNTGMVLTLALNYGGRREILDAVAKACARSREKGFDISSLKEEDFAEYLYTGDLPDPDLIIRTSGEKRLSNFLLWQAAYSEIYVTDTLWPDFNEKELEKAFNEYSERSRRFGK